MTVEELAIEEFARSKYPRSGKCSNSCFVNGWHRVGIVEVKCLLDGGLSGNSAMEICLECGKIFKQPRWFVPKEQPNRLNSGASKSNLPGTLHWRGEQ